MTRFIHEHSRYWRHGFCDALFDRPCKSPLPQSYAHTKLNAEYLEGYMAGEDKAHELQLRSLRA